MPQEIKPQPPIGPPIPGREYWNHELYDRMRNKEITVTIDEVSGMQVAIFTDKKH